jgi:hypothetical protein
MKRSTIIGTAAVGILALIALLFFPIFIGTRPLTIEEIALAKPFFETSLDYERIRINYGGPLTRIYPALTTGNTISFPKGFDGSNKKAQALILHEMTHVWQHQNHGIGYLPRALFEEITEPNPYTVHYDVSKHFLDYDIEEQAEIAAGYFLNQNESYLPYIAELRAK